MSTTTTVRSGVPFTDWRNESRIDHQLTDAEVLERFGNHRDTPDPNAATYIPWWEVSNEQKRLDGSLRRTLQTFYKHLDLYNQGAWNLNTENQPFTTYRQKRDVISSLASQLELNASQRSLVRQQFLWLELQTEGVSMELVALALCAYAVHSDYKDNKSTRCCHPQTPAEKSDRVFAKVLQTIYDTGRLGPHDFEKEYGKMQHQFRNWPTLSRKDLEAHQASDSFDSFGIDERSYLWEEAEKIDAGVSSEMSVAAEVETFESYR